MPYTNYPHASMDSSGDGRVPNTPVPACPNRGPMCSTERPTDTVARDHAKPSESLLDGPFHRHPTPTNAAAMLLVRPASPRPIRDGSVTGSSWVHRPPFAASEPSPIPSGDTTAYSQACV